MTADFNSIDLCTITLLGNIVNKPEIRYQANPIVAIAELTIATHTRWFDKNSKQFKEWTNYHTVKVIGDTVENSLVHAEKGDVILIEGYLLNSKKSNREIIHATFSQCYPKGYAQSVNQVNCSGIIASPIKLVTTESDKLLAEFTMTINHQVYSPFNNSSHTFSITRTVNVWGKQAQYIDKNAQLNDKVFISGKLSYANNAEKSQIFEAKQVDLLK